MAEGRIKDQKSPAQLGYEPAGQRDYSLLDEETEIVSSAEEGNPTRDEGRFSWSWIYGKFLSVVRTYGAAVTPTLLKADGQNLASVSYAAANETESATSSAPVTFEEDYLIGFDTVKTGNITFDFTGAIQGVTVVIKHNDSTEPTFPSELSFVNGTQSYQTGVDNYLILRHYNSSLVVGWIHQLTDTPSANNIGGTVDGHTHANLDILNAINNAGSGQIITDAERTKLSQLNTGFLGWYATPSQLNTENPTGTTGQSAIVGSTNTYWIWDGVAWVDSGSANSSVTITDAEVKTKYENNADTNAYTDAEKAKLAGLTTGGIDSVVGGTDITIDNTDPNNPIVNYSGGGGGGGGLTLIEEIEVTGSPASTIDFTGLDTDADLSDGESYVLDFINCKSTGAAAFIQIRFNSDSSSNYKTYTTGALQTFIGTDMIISTSAADAGYSRIIFVNPKTVTGTIRPLLGICAGNYFATHLSAQSDGFENVKEYWNTNTNITEINIVNATYTVGSIVRLSKGYI